MLNTDDLNLKSDYDGVTFHYDCDHDGSKFRNTEVVTSSSFGNNSYELCWKSTESKPKQPLRDYHCSWKLFEYNEGTRVKWTRSFKVPYMLGCIPIGNYMKNGFIRSAHEIMKLFARYWLREYPRRFPRKTDKVVIIGAGPSGLHMAHLLVKNGHDLNNITIYEKTGRYGGKSLTISDKDAVNHLHDNGFHTSEGNQGPIPTEHELGTCYLHPAYFAVRDGLFKELAAAHNTSPEALFQEVAPDSYVFTKPGHAQLTIDEWIASMIQVQPSCSFFNPCRILFPIVDSQAEMLLAKSIYSKLHESIFGRYHFSMPPPVCSSLIPSIDMPFYEFLRIHKLTSLIPVLAYGQTCQGYGSIEHTPTFWAMCWITPQLLDGYFALRANNPLNPSLKADCCSKQYPIYPKKGMLTRGWINVWDQLVTAKTKESCIRDRIEYGRNVTRITRKGVQETDGRHEIKVTCTEGKSLISN